MRSALPWNDEPNTACELVGDLSHHDRDPDVYTSEDGAKRGSSFRMSGSICNYARAECAHAPKHIYQSAHLPFSGHEFVCRHGHLEMTNTR
jgi:hypothetical protein